MLDQLIERSERFDEHNHDYGPRPAQDFRFDATTASLVVPQELFSVETVLPMTDWAFKQACQKLGPAAFPESSRMLPADYLLACPPDMRATQLNHWLDVLPRDRQWFVRGYREQTRAILSERYATVGVTETLKWVKEALDSHGGPGGVQIYNPVVTPDVLHVRLLFRDLKNDEGHYAVGGYITTGEIGNRRIGAYPLIQRISCTNSIAIPDNAWSWESRHVGEPTVLKHAFIAAIFHVLKGAVDALDRLLSAREDELPNFTDYVDQLVKEQGWSPQVRDSILVGSESYESLFGVVNGISYAARQLDDEDARADMELFAGRVLVARR